MKFSINIPVYNGEKYIDECFRSILEQSYGNFEVIVVDDGSNDDTPKIADDWARRDKRWTVIHQVNQGQMAARTKALERNSGDYSLFLDGDDLLEKETLAVLRDKITKHRWPDMLIFNYYILKIGGKINGPSDWNDERLYAGPKVDELLLRACCSDLFNSLCYKAIKNPVPALPEDLLERCKDMRMGEDAVQSIFYIEQARSIALITNRLYVYRYNEASVCNVFNKEKFFKDIGSVRAMLAYKEERLKKNNLFDEKAYFKSEYHYLKAYTYIAALSSPKDRQTRFELYKLCRESFEKGLWFNEDKLVRLYLKNAYFSIDRYQMIHMRLARLKRTCLKSILRRRRTA